MNSKSLLPHPYSSTQHRVWIYFACYLAMLIYGLIAVPAYAQTSREELASVQRWMKLAKQSVPFELDVVEYPRKERSPLVAIVTKQKSCLLVVNEKEAGWSAWDQFVESTGLPAQEVMAFATLHEIGHCVNRLVHDNGWQGVSAGQESELFADVYAFAVLAQIFDAERFARLSDGIVKARRAQSGFFWSGSHNTADGLARFSDYLSHNLPVEDVRLPGRNAVDSGRVLATNWFLTSATAVN